MFSILEPKMQNVDGLYPYGAPGLSAFIKNLGDMSRTHRKKVEEISA